MPVVSVREAVVSEGGGYVDLVFTLDEASLSATSFSWNTSAGTALGAGADYTTASGSVNFAAGVTTATLRITLTNDQIAEGTESFLVTLGAANGLTLFQNQFLVVIDDNDTVAAMPGLSVHDVTVDEGEGVATFVVTLDAASAGTVTVDFSTTGGTALGADFSAAAGTLTFAPGETVKTITVSLIDDATAEGREGFGVLLGNASANATIVGAKGHATIVDDDAQTGTPSVSVADGVVGEGQGWVDVVVSLSRPSTSVVSVTVTSNATGGTASAADFQSRATIVNFEPGEVTRTLRLQINDDALDEGTEFVAVTLSNLLNATLGAGRATVAIVDNDRVSTVPPGLSVGDVVVDEQAGTATFTVRLGGGAGVAAGGTVRVDYATGTGTADADDFLATSGTLVFAAGETVKTVTVDLVDDALAEGAERFSLLLSGATGATLHDARGDATIGASDGAGAALPRLSVDSVVAGEGDGWVEVTVRLSAPSEAIVTATLTTTGGTATGSTTGDFLVATRSVVFAAGETVQTVRIALIDDAVAEATEALTVSLAAVSNATIGANHAVVGIVDNDGAADATALTVRDVWVDEAAGVVRFVVERGGPAAGDLTFDYATADGSALAGSDYVAQSGTLTFGAGETVKTVSVDLIDDGVTEGRETFDLVLDNATGAATTGTRGQASISASDAIAVATPRLTAHDVVVGEGAGFVDVLVTLDAPGLSTVTVSYVLNLASAVGGPTGDFVGTNDTLTFAAGETAKTVRVALVNDSVAEGAQTFTVTLTAPTNATIVRPEARITIVDNDNPGGTAGLWVRDAVVDEAAGTVTFTVLLGGAAGFASAGVVTVDYATTSGTATAGSDFTATTGSLSFGPGETVKNVTVALNDDALQEGAEWFELVLSNPSGAMLVQGSGRATLGASDAATQAAQRFAVSDVVVGEGDGWVDMVVTMAAPSAQDVQIRYAMSPGTALFTNNSASQDYLSDDGIITFVAGETTKTVRVEITNGAGAENLEYFVFKILSANGVRLANGDASVHIVDNDTAVATPAVTVDDVVVDERAGTATFVLTLGGQAAAGPVSVAYATASGTATAGSDFTAASGTLHFAAGETVKTVVVDLADDVLAEGVERFFLQLSAPSGATFADSRGQAVIGRSDAATAALPLVSIGDVIVGEGDGYADVLITLGAPTTDVVRFSVDGVAGTAGSTDFLADTGFLAFEPGQTTMTVRLAIADDTLAEGAESFFVLLSNATGGVLGSARGMVTVIDDDTATVTPTLSVRDVVVDERAGLATFTVLLGGPGGRASTGPVSVGYATGGGTAVSGVDFGAASGMLVFAAGETAKTITVDLTDDTLAEGFESFHLDLSNAVGASLLDNRAEARIGASDGAPVALPGVSVDAVSAGEGDGWVDVVVRLSAPSAGNVVVTYATAVDTATSIANADFVARSGSIGFAPGETTQVVRVQLGDDGTVEALEGFRFQLGTVTGATITTASTTVTVFDDDAPPVASPQVFVRDVVVDEESGLASFVVTLGTAGDAVAAGPVTVTWATAPGTWFSGEDYVTASGELTFAPGQTQQTVVIALAADTADEPEERLFLNLATVSGGTLVNGTAVAVIAPSDAAPVAVPGLSIDDATVVENEGWVDLTVRLSAPGTGAVTVNWSTGDGTATSVAGADFTAASGSLVFAAGQTLKTVRVQLGNGSTAEAGESFVVSLTGVSGGTLVKASATVTVLDDDSGFDVLRFGRGNNTYVVDQTADLVVEAAGGGDDTVGSAAASYTLPDHVEVLVLTGAASITGIGNTLANVLRGNAGGDSLVGGAGNDDLDGGPGGDTMVGGTGDDLYTVELAGEVITELAGGGTDTVYALATTILSVNVEHLQLGATLAVNGTGNASNNRITGNVAVNALFGAAGNDTLDGGAGNDAMTGNAGDDVYVVAQAGDTVTEAAAEGIDTVQAGVSWGLGANLEHLTLTTTANLSGNGNELSNRIVGNAGVNILKGLAGNDTLDGGSGADRLDGGSGNDTYVVDNLSEILTELAAGGTDSVQSLQNWTLGLEFENLQLIGTANTTGRGNAVANVLTGNTGANLLTGLGGNDSLDGGSGSDTMLGGLGDDTYTVGASTDVVTEGVAEGSDTVRSSVTRTLGVNQEHLVLTGTAAINGTGNSQANRLTGNAAANTLDGGTGSDTMSGGAGSDGYLVDSIGDVVTEAAAAGTDRVQSSVNFTLGANVENLTLTGSALLATGNTGANVIAGNAAGNTITGGAGSDTLTGGAGADVFVLKSLIGTDTITDYSVTSDTMRLSMTAVRIGDGDTLVENAQVPLALGGGYSAAAELVLFTPNIVGAITAASAAPAIGTAASAFGTGSTRLFIVDNGSQTGIFRFVSSAADATVSASELTLLALLNGTSTTNTADYVFIA